VNDFPIIRTRPDRRQYRARARYTRRRRGPSVGAWLAAWIFGGLVGVTVGLLVLFYGWGLDPAGLAGRLPTVNVQWGR
jgi:predicted branched-subunit amino acid permease